MNIALWVLAGVLAAVFLASGAQKLALSKERLVASGLGSLEAFGTGGIKGIGALEVLGAAALILPAAFSVLPVLVPLAAVGFALLMAGAAVVHTRRREAQGIAATAVLLVLTVLLAWGRFGTYALTV
jgi:uncharacterized membrane protein YphA (DoxX/SURF4 family)